MLKIPQEKVFERWDKMPLILREALLSTQNSDLIWEICGTANLNDEQIDNVAFLVGDVIFGFIHTDDLAKEIEKLNIEKQSAMSVADEIKKKIFAPIKMQLEKNYSPVAAEEVENLAAMTEATIAPEIVPAEKEKPPVVIESELMGMAPKIEPSIMRGTLVEMETKKPEIAISKPVEPSAPIMPPAVEKAPAVKEMAEPFILHTEVEFKPSPVVKKNLGGIFGLLTKKEKPEIAATAKIEIGGIEEKTMGAEKIPTPSPVKSEPVKPRIVHYTQFQTPLSPIEVGLETPPFVMAPVVSEKPAEEKVKEFKPAQPSAINMEKQPVSVNIPTAPISVPIPPAPVVAPIIKENIAVAPVELPGVEEIKPIAAEPTKIAEIKSPAFKVEMPILGLDEKEQKETVEVKKEITPEAMEKKSETKIEASDEDVIDLRTMKVIKR